MVGYVAIVAKYLEEKLWFKSVALDRNLVGTFFLLISKHTAMQMGFQYFILSVCIFQKIANNKWTIMGNRNIGSFLC